MSDRTFDAFNHKADPHDPKLARYWMRQGPKTAAFLLVIPGCAIVGAGIGLLLSHPLPYSLIGFGAGLLLWGLIVALAG
jgi:hypothetical protein